MIINRILIILAYFNIFFIKILSKFCKTVYIVSDSHCAINPIIFKYIKSADTIIHSGDWSSIEVYEDLKEVAKKIIAVHGNTDTTEIEKILPAEKSIEINSIKINIVHELYNIRNFTQSDMKYNLIIFGHTHKPYKKKIKGITFYNPGSCGPRRFSNVPPSFGVLFIIKTFFFIRTIKIPFQTKQGFY